MNKKKFVGQIMPDRKSNGFKHIGKDFSCQVEGELYGLALMLSRNLDFTPAVMING
jgi:hypothetical protein